MKKKALLLFPLISLLLAGCNVFPSISGSTFSRSSPSSSDPSSSSIPSTSSEAPSSYSNQEMASFIVAQANKYDEDITLSHILEEAKRLDPSFAEEGLPTGASFLLLSYLAFNETLPSRRGARGFEFYENPANPALSGYEEDSIYAKAFRFWAKSGIIDSSSFLIEEEIDAETAWILLDRIHYYYSCSPVDDFFAYANYEERIAECESNGASPDDDIEKINLATTEDIDNWSKKIMLDNHDAYSYYHALTSIGESNLLSPMIEEYMASSSASELLSLFIKNQNLYGYSPMYYLCNISHMTQPIMPTTPWEGLKWAHVMMLPYWNEPSSSLIEGSEAYKATVEEYEPLFSSLLNDEIEGATRAKDYASFLYEVTLSCEKYRPDYFLLYQADTSLLIGDTGQSFGDFFSSIHYGDTVYNVCNLNNYRGFFDIFDDEHLEELKAYVLYVLIEHYKSLLPDTPLFNEHIGYPERNSDSDFYYANILPPIASNLINSYTKTDTYKKDAETLFDLFYSLKEEMGKKIDESSWLSEKGKEASHAKLNSMRASIGMNYSEDDVLRVTKEYPYGSLPSSSSAFDYLALYEKGKYEEEVAKLGTTDEVMSTIPFLPSSALDINAIYERNHNGIRFYLGMMIANEGMNEMSKERLLGGLGFTMAHEIGHGFDATGFDYDAKGNLDPSYMGEEDRSAFSSLTEQYAAYMDGYEALPGKATDGNFVLNEAVADNIGLSLSSSLGEKDDSFDEATYFRECARIYGGYITRKAYESRYETSNAHPCQRARINRLFSSSSLFHEVYRVKEGDFMYVAPEKRIKFY